MFKSYFKGNYILSKGALLNGVFSDRSDGKTFDCKARALEDYEANKRIAIYMRRFKTEITDKMYNSFFDEVISKDEYKRFSKWKFKGCKKGVQVQTEDGGKWDWIVFFIPLSVSARMKSQISEIERIKYIDYDEFIPLDNRYLKDEIVLLLEFWKSIDRDRDTTQIIILGNKITPFNPLFDYFGIELDIEKEKIRMYKNDTIAIQIYSSKEHRQARETSNFRKMISNTSYEDYDNGGVLNAIGVNTMSKEGGDYICSFKTTKGEGSLWFKDGKLVVSNTLRYDGYVLTDKIYNLNREQYQANFGRFPKMLKHYYTTGNMFFESEKCFYIFKDILTKAGGV